MNSEGASPTKVLVVDDERALAAVIASYLTRAGHHVTQAHSGPDAVTQAKAEDPDVIVLDLGLPGLDGVEVCRQVRTFSDCYILILTARGDEIDRLIGLSRRRRLKTHHTFTANGFRQRQTTEFLKDNQSISVLQRALRIDIGRDITIQVRAGHYHYQGTLRNSSRPRIN